MAEAPVATICDELRLATDGVLEVDRRWLIRNGVRTRLAFGVQFAGSFPRWVVPAVMYDGNAEGSGKFPRGGPEVGWSFREDRCPIPSCAILCGAGGGWALFTRGAETEEELSSIKTFLVDGDVTLEIATPFEEAPATYREKGYPLGGQSRPTRAWFPADRHEYQRSFYLLPTGGERIPFGAVFAAARRRFAPRNDGWSRTDWARYVELKVHYLRHVALFRDRHVTGIIRGLGMLPGLQRIFCDFVSGSFLSKSLEAAVCFARLAPEYRDQSLSNLAQEIADSFLAGELPSGLAFDEYSIHRRRFGGFFLPGRHVENLASTRCMGECGQQYARLAEVFGSSANPRWIAHARGIADFFVSRQQRDGNYGRFYRPTGELEDARGTNGAYIMWLMADLYRLTADRRYFVSARKAADFFITSAVANQRFGFDTLDAECTDKEAGHALLRAFLLLHALQPEPAILNAAREAAEYCLSWQFCWDIPFSPRSQLGKAGFHTFGGTAVSVAHHHLDVYGLVIALDFLRLGRALGEDSWTQYAKDLVGFCGQLVSTREKPLNKGVRFVGYEPEQFNHTDWDYIHHLVGGKGHYFGATSWVASATLGACLEIRAEFPQFLPKAESVNGGD